MPLITKILVATDFSPHAGAALGYGIDLAVTYAAPVVLLHVYSSPVVAVPDGYVTMAVDEVAALVPQLQAGLDQAAGRARDLGVASVTTRLVDGIAWQQIPEIASSEQCDLIVMGTHGRSGIAHLLIGSVAEKVVRKATCAVLTVHGPR